MYNTTILCTYNTPEVFLDTDSISETDKDFVRNAIYRQEFLNILGLKEYDEKELDNSINNLYEKIKVCSELKECIVKVLNHFMIDDNKKIGLMILYSYDYMYLTHICVSEFIEKGSIEKATILKLKSVLF